MKRNKSNSGLFRQYETPKTKTCQMISEQSVLVSSIEDEVIKDVDTPLIDLGGFAGGGDPAKAD